MPFDQVYQTIAVSYQDPVCFIKFDRPDSQNTINVQMVKEIADVLSECKNKASIVVFEGSNEVFCFGADFKAVGTSAYDSQPQDAIQSNNPEALYDIWQLLKEGEFISVAHVVGKANAGGIGFIAACDIVIANPNAEFSLSELLFGLMPACVIPFLKRRIGTQRTHYMTLTTQSISANQAYSWGLVDVLDINSADSLRKHLLRFRRLSKKSIKQYKEYIGELQRNPDQEKALAIKANQSVLSDPENIAGILRYQREGIFPWETS
jgi:polyketide biosynthesis enoyl-CoA hydratase PksH